jgi:glycosyltransferase involved in cell wall biosynthesis
VTVPQTYNQRGMRTLLTVVVPVYNGGDEIVENVGVIRRAVTDQVGGDVEIVVVSDGSIDGTAERVLETREPNTRVLHYDRNLGKGYAVKTGAMAARGEWVALIDADLDLDPRSIPSYLATARAEGLDFAIGSKRHPESVVSYPRSRRIASWCYQQLNRLLFRLDVRDTQVGLKVFSRRVADEVVPLLIVKRFAFDLELLAVAASLGYGRIRELPIRLDYRFTGSGVRSLAVLSALWDTAAIFYRLRILRTYERRRRLFHGGGSGPPPSIAVVGNATVDYPRLEPAERAELVAVVAPHARPASNWLWAAAPYFADPRVAAVVVPSVAPLRGPLRERVAAAVLESRFGGGSRRTSYFPGNVRVVVDYPAESIVLRRSAYEAVTAAGLMGEEIVPWLASHGQATIYTPDTSLAAPASPVFRAHLADTVRHGRARGALARRSRGRSLSLATALSLAPGAAAIAGVVAIAVGDGVRTLGLALVIAYGAALVASGVHAAARFRSLAVGLLEPPAVMATHAAYAYAFVRGVLERGM